MHLDLTMLALQTVNILVLAWLLTRFLYRPVRTLIAERRATIERQMAQATDALAKAKADAAEMARRREGFAAEGERILAEAQHEAEAQTATARAQAEAQIARLRQESLAEAERERRGMQDEVTRHAARLAVEIAERLLARMPAEAATQAALTALPGMIAGLEEENRRRLGTQEEPVMVVTAMPVDTAAQARVTDMLRAALGHAVTVGFRTDAGLIGGVELQSAHVRLRDSLRADLDRIAQELSREDTHAGAAG